MGDYLAEQRMIEESVHRSMTEPTIEDVREAHDWALYGYKYIEPNLQKTILHALTKLEESMK